MTSTIIDVYTLLEKFGMNIDQLNYAAADSEDTNYFWGYYRGINQYDTGTNNTDAYRMGYRDGMGDRQQ